MREECRHFLIVMFFCSAVYFLSLSTEENLKTRRVLTKPKKHNFLNKTNQNRNRVIQLEYCKCLRTIQRKEEIIKTDFSQTTCGQDAYQRGSHQKVVAFSFYGNPKAREQRKRKYFQGIEKNLGEISAMYGQEWIMRLYINLKISDPIFKNLCNLACNNPNIDLCVANNLPGNPVDNATKIFPRIWQH